MTGADGAGFLLWRAANRWQRRIRAELRPLGLTHVQFALLAALSARRTEKTSVNQASLARSCGIDAMMASQVLRTLERRGWIRRDRDPADPRAHRVVLSTAGSALVGRARGRVAEVDRALTDALGADAPALGAALARLAGVRTRIRVRAGPPVASPTVEPDRPR